MQYMERFSRLVLAFLDETNPDLKYYLDADVDELGIGDISARKYTPMSINTRTMFQDCLEEFKEVFEKIY